MEEHDFFSSTRHGAHHSHLVQQAIAVYEVGGEANAMGTHGIATAVVVIGHLWGGGRGGREGRKETGGEIGDEEGGDHRGCKVRVRAMTDVHACGWRQ